MKVVRVQGPGIKGPFGGSTDLHQIEDVDKVVVEEDGMLVIRPVDIPANPQRTGRKGRVVRYAAGVWNTYETYEREGRVNDGV